MINPKSHFYLYAKNHYHTTDMIQDLKAIISNYTGNRPEHIRTIDIIEFLIATVEPHLKPTMFHDMIIDTLPTNGWKCGLDEIYRINPKITQEERVIGRLLQFLAFTKVIEDDGTVLIPLDPPDENILPLRHRTQ